MQRNKAVRQQTQHLETIATPITETKQARRRSKRAAHKTKKRRSAARHTQLAMTADIHAKSKAARLHRRTRRP
jgi:hypothetical protein